MTRLNARVAQRAIEARLPQAAPLTVALAVWWQGAVRVPPAVPSAAVASGLAVGASPLAAQVGCTAAHAQRGRALAAASAIGARSLHTAPLTPPLAVWPQGAVTAPLAVPSVAAASGLAEGAPPPGVQVCRAADAAGCMGTHAQLRDRSALVSGCPADAAACCVSAGRRESAGCWAVGCGGPKVGGWRAAA